MNVKAITILSGDGNRVEICVVPLGKSAYEDDDKLTETNSKLFTFEWSADNG